MAENVRTLIDWLSQLPSDCDVGITEEGLTLAVIRDGRLYRGSGQWGNEYYEVGGTPSTIEHEQPCGCDECEQEREE